MDSLSSSLSLGYMLDPGLPIPDTGCDELLQCLGNGQDQNDRGHGSGEKRLNKIEPLFGGFAGSARAATSGSQSTDPRSVAVRERLSSFQSSIHVIAAAVDFVFDNVADPKPLGSIAPELTPKTSDAQVAHTRREHQVFAQGSGYDASARVLAPPTERAKTFEQLCKNLFAQGSGYDASARVLAPPAGRAEALAQFRGILGAQGLQIRGEIEAFARGFADDAPPRVLAPPAERAEALAQFRRILGAQGLQIRGEIEAFTQGFSDDVSAPSLAQPFVPPIPNARSLENRIQGTEIQQGNEAVMGQGEFPIPYPKKPRSSMARRARVGAIESFETLGRSDTPGNGRHRKFAQPGAVRPKRARAGDQVPELLARDVTRKKPALSRGGMRFSNFTQRP